VFVGLAVGVFVGGKTSVGIAVTVAVDVSVGAGVDVYVEMEVAVGIIVSVAVNTAAGVDVGNEVFVGVAVGGGWVAVLVGSGVSVGVEVGCAVAVGNAVFVGVGAPTIGWNSYTPRSSKVRTPTPVFVVAGSSIRAFPSRSKSGSPVASAYALSMAGELASTW
jgi:hypothetical protein